MREAPGSALRVSHFIAGRVRVLDVVIVQQAEGGKRDAEDLVAQTDDLGGRGKLLEPFFAVLCRQKFYVGVFH